MDCIRLVLRMTAVIPWTLFCYALRIVVLPVMWIAPAFERRLRSGIFRTWARGVWAIVGIRVTVQGTPPAPPYYQVSNHLSYIDIIVVAGVLGCVFVSKAEVANWPVVGLIVRGLNTIFIDRARMRDTMRVNTLIGDALDRGYGIHMFAEGGVSQDCTVNRFKPPLLEPAVQKGCPVHYAAISYRTSNGSAPASEVVAWLEGVSFGGHILRLLRLPGFDATITFGEAPITGNDRKELADALCDAVRARFTPLN